MKIRKNNVILKTKRVQAPYSMPGVLHYIQNEWGRYELERAQWEMERSELKVGMGYNKYG